MLSHRETFRRKRKVQPKGLLRKQGMLGLVLVSELTVRFGSVERQERPFLDVPELVDGKLMSVLNLLSVLQNVR